VHGYRSLEGTVPRRLPVLRPQCRAGGGEGGVIIGDCRPDPVDPSHRPWCNGDAPTFSGEPMTRAILLSLALLLAATAASAETIKIGQATRHYAVQLPAIKLAPLVDRAPRQHADRRRHDHAHVVADGGAA
jgi:hypothetical protein